MGRSGQAADDLLAARLFNVGLAGPPCRDAAQAVARLGAVQAQDFAAAKWALGLRIREPSEADIDRGFDAGSILRTHVLRPTWHFVRPQDIRWMLALTAPRIRARMASQNRKLDLDAKLISKANAAMAKAIAARGPLERQELKRVLAGIGIATDVQRLAHLVMEAELEALICSGPRRGKRFTYALLEDRVPATGDIPREEALARLALAYFRGHGPARLDDFSWWSGLSRADSEAALASIRSKLRRTVRSGRDLWGPPAPKAGYPEAPRALLLSIFDEYTIAYSDRSALSEARDIERMIRMGNALTGVFTLEGKVAGGWKRALGKKGVTVSLRPFRKLTRYDRESLEAAAERYGRFVGKPARCEGLG